MDSGFERPLIGGSREEASSSHNFTPPADET
jgi:hypothetical protein